MRPLCIIDLQSGDHEQEILSSISLCPKWAIFAKIVG
jgi:hypothetical protein